MKVTVDKSLSRPWLIIAYELGKIGCATLVPFMFAPSYAVLAATTAGLGVSKFLFDAYCC